MRKRHTLPGRPCAAIEPVGTFAADGDRAGVCGDDDDHVHRAQHLLYEASGYALHLGEWSTRASIRVPSAEHESMVFW